MTKRLSLVLLSTLMSIPMPGMAVVGDYPEAGLITDYFTMVTAQKVRRHCSGEGGQITGGEYIGSDCKPFKAKFCRWGVGNRNNCLIPCVDGAGGRARLGKIVRIKPRMCNYGPFKGQTIRFIRISDVGGAVQGTHVDVFQGLCLKEKGGRCLEYGEESNYAQYRGVDKYDETHNTVVAMLQQMGLPTQYAEAPGGTTTR